MNEWRGIPYAAPPVGALPPSEDLLEVDFTDGVVSAVGNQFGIGRVVT